MSTTFVIAQAYNDSDHAFRMHLIAACIEALGGEVIMKELTSLHGVKQPYLRDGAFIIPEERIVFISPDEKPPNYLLLARDALLEEIQKIEGYRIIEVDAYLEGGNLLYDPDRRIIMHGTGESSRIDHATPPRMLGEGDDNRMLQRAARQAIGDDVEIIPVSTHPKRFLQERGLRGTQENQVETPFHLDLYANLSSSGALFVCAEVIKPAFLYPLEETYGDSLKKVSVETYLGGGLNGVYVGEFYLAQFCAPKDIPLFEAEGYTVITPQTLAKHPQIAAQVAERMHAYGHPQVTAKNILRNPETGRSIDFWEENGLVHCVTNELTPPTRTQLRDAPAPNASIDPQDKHRGAP